MSGSNTSMEVTEISPQLKDIVRDGAPKLVPAIHGVEVQQRLTDSAKWNPVEELHPGSPKRPILEYSMPSGVPLDPSNPSLEILPTPLASPEIPRTFLAGGPRQQSHNGSLPDHVPDPRLQSNGSSTLARTLVAPPQTSHRPIMNTSIPSPLNVSATEVINVGSEDGGLASQSKTAGEDLRTRASNANYDGLMRIGESSRFAPTVPLPVRLLLHVSLDVDTNAVSIPASTHPAR